MRWVKPMIYFAIIFGFVLGLSLTGTFMRKSYTSEISVGYGQLSARKKAVYDELACQFDGGTLFAVEMADGLSEQDYADLLTLIVNTDWRYFYVRDVIYEVMDDGRLAVRYNPVIDRTEVADYINAANKVIMDISEAVVDKPVRERFQAYYDCVSAVDYVRLGDLETTAVGALVNGTANCQGYAKALRLFCVRNGIPCRLVRGTLEDEAHMWNSVYINGRWYYSDACNGGTPLFSDLPRSYVIEQYS